MVNFHSNWSTGICYNTPTSTLQHQQPNKSRPDHHDDKHKRRTYYDTTPPIAAISTRVALKNNNLARLLSKIILNIHVNNSASHKFKDIEIDECKNRNK